MTRDVKNAAVDQLVEEVLAVCVPACFGDSIRGRTCRINSISVARMNAAQSGLPIVQGILAV